MNYACSIELSPKNPQAVVNALKMDEVYERSTTSIELSGDKVFIKISAKDITALRAAVNDYMRLLRVCEAVDV